VNFILGELGVATHESIAVRVTGELLSEISDNNDQTRNGRGTERGSRTETSRVSVKMKSTFLNGRSFKFTIAIVPYRCIAWVIAALRGSIFGGTTGFQVPLARKKHQYVTESYCHTTDQRHD
jgi:hypothetical protein